MSMIALRFVLKFQGFWVKIDGKGKADLSSLDSRCHSSIPYNYHNFVVS